MLFLSTFPNHFFLSLFLLFFYYIYKDLHKEALCNTKTLFSQVLISKFTTIT